MGALLYAYYFSCGCHASSQARAAPRARVYGMLVKEWKKASSLRHARTWQHWRKIMRKSESRQPKARARRKDMATSSELRSLFWQSSAHQHAIMTRIADDLQRPKRVSVGPMQK